MAKELALPSYDASELLDICRNIPMLPLETPSKMPWNNRVSRPCCHSLSLFLNWKKKQKKNPKKSEFQSIECELSSSLTDAETSLDRFGVVRETHRGLEGKQTRPDHRVGAIDSPFVGIVNPLCHPNNVYFNQCLPRYSASVLISPAKTGRSESESDVTSWRMISPAWICRSFFEIPI